MALKYASITLIAPLGAVSLVINVINSHLWLHEHVHMRDLIATGLVMLGCVFTVVFGPGGNTEYDYPKIEAAFVQVNL